LLRELWESVIQWAGDNGKSRHCFYMLILDVPPTNKTSNKIYLFIYLLEINQQRTAIKRILTKKSIITTIFLDYSAHLGY
jgi:hypothetical protein